MVITNNQISARIDEETKEKLNEYLRIQEENGIVFTSIRELFNFLIENTTKQAAVNVEVLPAEIERCIYDIKIELGYTSDELETEPDAKQVLEDCLSILKTPLEAVEPVEIVKEVQIPLSENELLISLSEKQHEILKKIHRFRSSKKYVEPPETIQEVVKGMVFNLGTLTNYSEEYETGIRNAKKL